MFLGICVAIAAFLIDQVSKWSVMAFLDKAISPIKYGNYFNLVEAWNTGVSFSMFNDGGLVGSILLSVFALGVIIFLLFWLKKEPNRLIQVSLGMIIGGALGNVFDRVRFGAVYDFLDFHYKTLHLPAFNAADSFICIGAFIIIVCGLLSSTKTSSKEGSK